mgnify:CR=1 FL=1
MYTPLEVLDRIEELEVLRAIVTIRTTELTALVRFMMYTPLGVLEARIERLAALFAEDTPPCA